MLIIDKIRGYMLNFPVEKKDNDFKTLFVQAF